MSIDAAVRRRLLDDNAIVNSVGSRVYNVVVPANSDYPCVTLNFEGGAVPLTLGNSGAGVREYTFEVGVYVKSDGASAFNAAGDLRDLIIAQLNGFSGVLSDHSKNDYNIVLLEFSDSYLELGYVAGVACSKVEFSISLAE